MHNFRCEILARNIAKLKSNIPTYYSVPLNYVQIYLVRSLNLTVTDNTIYVQTNDTDTFDIYFT